MRRTLIVAFVCTAALPACAQDAGSSTSTMIGQPDCGAWVRSNRQSDRAWLLGYLSGINQMNNAANKKPTDPLGALKSADQIFLWMDNWCKANPLKKVGEGGAELFVELRMNKR